MNPIPETRTELIDLFTSEKILCTNCNQNQIFQKRSEIHCPLIPKHSSHVVLECSGCGTMTTIDRSCNGFVDLRELMGKNNYEISKDEQLISKYPEWVSSYGKHSLSFNDMTVPPTFFNWETFWEEIRTHTDWKSLIGFKDKLLPDFVYSFDIDSQKIVISHPEEGQFRISLSDFQNVHDKMTRNKIQNKKVFDNFSNLDLYTYSVWRSACRGKDFWEKHV